MSTSQGEAIIHTTIPDDYQGQRLDKALAQLLPDYSRSRLQQWLEQGLLTVNGQSPARKARVAGGEIVQLTVPTMPDDERVEAEPVPLDIIDEDDDLLVLNKPAGLVMHPGAGNHHGTLQNGLLHYAPSLAALPRSGIVHRIDKDTSGIVVVAKTFTAHKHLAAAFAERSVLREYEAVVCGMMTAGGRVDAPIDRHPVNRKKMAVRQGGREAITHYKVLNRFRGYTHVRCQLETGRTHQIRVHMAHIRHPLLGDPVYGRRLALPKQASEELATTLRGFKRQALHARRLGLVHPITGEQKQWQAPYADDFQQLLTALGQAQHDAAL